MENKTAGWRRRVDVLCQGPEAGPALPDDLYNLQKVFQGPAQGGRIL